jgi:hypothetical protein
MGNTYFVRHSSDLDLDETTFNYLWKNNYIGIHYPQDINGKLGDNDISSIDPKDYSGSALKAINALRSLAYDGGYVCAVYRPFVGCKIGYVDKRTKIEIVKGTWGDKYELDGREAILKCIKIKKVKY